MGADDPRSRGITRRHVLESGAALAILGYVRPGFAAEVNPVAPPVLPSDPDVSTIPVRFTVNGAEQALTLDTRTTLLDALREHIGAHRHQEGLRPRPVRRLHGAGRRAAHQLLPDAGGHARGRQRSRPSRAWRTASSCIRCRPPSCSTTASSAATARRARSARRSACWPKHKAGLPSVVTDDLAERAGARPTPRSASA